MKNIILVVIGIIVGFISCSFFFKKEKTSSQEWAQQGLTIISQESDAQKQLALAEEYYGKAVVLFLATVANKQQVTNQSNSNAIEENVPETKTDDQVVTKSEGNEPALASSKPLNSATEDKAEKKETKQDEEIKMMVNYRNAKVLNKMTPELWKLMGSFSGQYKRETNPDKGQVDQVEVDIQLEKSGKHLMGTVKSQFTDPSGNIYSNSTSEGENVKLKEYTGGKNKIYLEVSPSNFVILDVSNREKLQGQVYGIDGRYKGRMVLNRKN